MRYLLMMLAVVLAGCGTTRDFRDYLTAQHSVTELSIKEQKPLVRIEAQPGQQITGLAKIEVYAPQAIPQIQQARPNEWAAVANNAIDKLGGVGQVIATGRAVVGIADVVGDAATAGYGYIQAPGAVTNIGDNSGANSGNSGRLAGGDVTDSTQPPVIVRPDVVRPDVVQIPTQVIVP